MKFNSMVFILAMVLAVFLAPGCSKNEDSVIRVNGSTTVAPITRKLAAAFDAKNSVRVTVASEGSHSGLDALIKGDCDIAESSSEAPPEYLEKAAKAGVVLKAFLIAHDHILPIVHPSNPVETLSVKQLRDIYTGKMTSWEPITNQKENMVVVGRSETSGTGDVWRNALNLGTEIDSKIVEKDSNSGILAFVAGNKNAVGYISAAFLNIEVKPLKISGTSSEKKSPHPIYRNLYLYVDEKKFSEDVRSFIVFALSAKGQRLIGELGFTPIQQN